MFRSSDDRALAEALPTRREAVEDIRISFDPSLASRAPHPLKTPREEIFHDLHSEIDHKKNGPQY